MYTYDKFITERKIKMAFCSRCGVSIEGRFCSACGYDNQPQEGVQNLAGSIEQLYSLRAGISLVSVQIDDINKEKSKGNNKISSCEKSINSLSNKIDNNKKTFDSCYKKLTDCKSNIAIAHKNQKEGKVEALEAEKEKSYIELQNLQKKHRKRNTILSLARIPLYGMFAIFALGGACGIAGFSLGLLMYGVIAILRIEKLAEFASFLDGPFAVISLVVGIVCSAIAILTFWLAKVLSRKIIRIDIEKKLSHWDNRIKECKALISKGEACEKTVVNLENEIEVLKQRKIELEQQSDLEKNALAEFKKKHKAEIDYYLLCSNETYNSLVKEYSPLIDVRDWENLDLVIYYLETRRAISVREALQLADRQHQTEAIIQTFKVATEQIKETITLNSQRLENTIIGCTKVISGRLQDISGRLNAIEVNQEIASSHLRNLSSQISVNNALQAKANTSSEQMMRDIRQMRVYADNAAIKARNS